MYDGFITLHRKILEWRWFSVDYMLSFFVKLLFLANYEDKAWGKIPILRGSFITSVKHLSELTGLTIWQVRLGLNRLQSTGEVTVKTTNKYTVITIVNYNTYQLIPGYKQQTNSKQTANKPQQLNKGNKVIKETNTTISFECEFFTVTNEEINDYCKAYNTTDEILNSEFIKMKIWLVNNPDKRKKNYGRFIGNWLNRHFNDNGKGGEKSGTDKKRELDAYMERTFGRTTST